MSKKGYVKKSYQVHTFSWEFTEGGVTHAGESSLYGDFLQAYIGFRTTHLWAKHPTFRIVSSISRKYD